MTKILLAEDDSSMRQFLGAALQKAGYEVEICEDGLDALEAVKKAPDSFELLLADIVMPGMDGIELARKASDLSPKLKVMFITGFAAVAMGQKDQTAGNARVLSKPFHLKELVDQVEQILAA
jgi:two-component system cell cycle response regulator CpdR